MATRKKDPLRGYKFIVNVPGFDRMGFKSCDGLNAEVAVIEYREGGDMATPRKIPGQTKFDNVTFERGQSSAEDGGADFISWFNQVFERSRGFLQPPNDSFRRNVTVTLHDKAGDAKVQWILHECWICRLEHEGLDASDDSALAIEKMELCNEGISKTIL